MSVVETHDLAGVWRPQGGLIGLVDKVVVSDRPLVRNRLEVVMHYSNGNSFDWRLHCEHLRRCYVREGSS